MAMPPQNTLPVWPPPPTTPPAPPTPTATPAHGRKGWVADLLLYALTWTVAALFVFASAFALAVHNAGFWPVVLLIGPLILVIAPPINVAWLVCMAVFGLAHRAWMGWVQRRAPFAGAARLRAYSVWGGIVIGLSQAVVVALIAVLLHLPGTEMMTLSHSPHAAPTPGDAFRAKMTDVLMYGVSAAVGSLCAGWAVGRLWARRAARTA